jgi:uncharacterized protein with von Willebrand factor type A (vWA) domain
MSIFDMIQGKILEQAKLAQQLQQQPPQQPQGGGDNTVLQGMFAGVEAIAGLVDIEQVLESISQQKGNPKLNWRTSIVDLMKLLDLDSSLANRAELATELGYQGEKNGSAEMNIWLHRAVMEQLEKNGGRVPDSLKG